MMKQLRIFLFINIIYYSQINKLFKKNNQIIKIIIRYIIIFNLDFL